MTMFKIFSEKDNLFSAGGIVPSFSKNGKFWNTVGQLKNHLMQRYSYTSTPHGAPITLELYNEEDVVIEYKIVEVKRTPIKEWLKEHESKCD